MKGLKSQNLRDHMSEAELIFTALAELSTRQIADSEKAKGLTENAKARFYKVINSKFLAEKIGMNATLLSQYVTGHKKPSELQTEKILKGIHQINIYHIGKFIVSL